MTFGRRKIAALAAGAVAVAGISAGAVAATGGSGDEASDLAAAINERAGTSITADQVEGAFQDLLKERLDEAVAAGRITQAQADEMLQRAQDAPGLPGLGFGRHGGPGGPGFGARGEVMEKVAAKLKLTEEQLHTRLHSGKTLAAIAKAQGVSRGRAGRHDHRRAEGGGRAGGPRRRPGEAHRRRRAPRARAAGRGFHP